jgi:hypothetical protein
MDTFVITMRDQLTNQAGGPASNSSLSAAGALSAKPARQKAVIEVSQAYTAQQQAGPLS